jgi:hypothetical protein
MLAIILCAALAVAVMAPQTPLGKAIRALTEAPARRLASLRRAHWVAAAVALGLIAGLILYARATGVWLAAVGLPEALSWFAVFDIATYMDVLGVLLLVAATVRLRATYAAVCAAARACRRVIVSVRRRVHAAVRRSPRRPRRSADGSDRPWLAIA